MSGFVPLQKAGSFQARMFKTDADAVGAAPPVPTSQPDNPPVEAHQEEAEGLGLPATVEELEALLEAVREETRIQVEGDIEDVRASLVQEREQVARLLEQVAQSRAEWTNEIRNVLGELVVVGVRQVVTESAELQTALIRDRLGEVGERLLSEQNVILRVRPADEDLARAMIGEREGWQIIPDSDLSGGVLAETEGGKVDATLGAALTGLAESVQGWQDEGIGEE